MAQDATVTKTVFADDWLLVIKNKNRLLITDH